MRVEWTDEFDRWLARIETKAEAGDEHAIRQLDYVAAELALLRDFAMPPARDAETAQLKWVRQHGRHEIWRVSHPYDENVAIRLICWFPPNRGTVVVTIFAGDKSRIGDAFYSSVGTRADAAIDRWLMHQTEPDPASADDSATNEGNNDG